MSAQARPDHAREVRYALTDPVAVCERLGLLAGRGTFLRQAGGVIVRCPWHEDRTPSCSIRRGRDGTIAVRCHGCGATGDVLSLVAIANGLNVRSDFRQVLRLGAEIAGLWALVHEVETGRADPARERTIAAPPPEPERTYPPTAEVGRVWGEAKPASEDPDAVAWLRSRALDVDAVEADDLARVVPVGARLPRWASYRRSSWTETGHRLIVPMRTADGAIASVRAIRIVDGDSPKRLPPGGHRATDLVMACPFATAMLQGTTRERWDIVIAEGEPDFLTWATRRKGPGASFGIVTGSWSFAMARRIPAGCRVRIRTDHDAAGERYADEIAKTLRWRGCFVQRGGRDDG